MKKPNWLRFSSRRMSLQKRWPFTTSMYYKIAVYNAQYAGHNRDPSAPGLFVIISRCRLIIIMMSKDRQQSKSVTSKMAESETTKRLRGNWIHQKQKSLKHFPTHRTAKKKSIYVQPGENTTKQGHITFVGKLIKVAFQSCF